MRMTLIAVALVLAGCSQGATYETNSSTRVEPVVRVRPASPAGTPQGMASQRLQSQEELTPYSSVMTYPSNWEEITRRRQ